MVTGALTVVGAGATDGEAIRLGTGGGVGVMIDVGTGDDVGAGMGDDVGDGTAVGIGVTVGDGATCGMCGTCGIFGTCGTDVGNTLPGIAGSARTKADAQLNRVKRMIQTQSASSAFLPFMMPPK